MKGSRMRTWVVTGPIGSGKSTVSSLLQERGAAVIDGDKIGHEVLRDPAIIAQVAADFGDDCVVKGQVDRSVLGAKVFDDQAAMDRLNALTHPAIVARIQESRRELARNGRHELAVLEAAVYFLWPPQEGIDKVISVLADPVVREERLVKGRRMRPETARRIIKIQDTLEPFWVQADVIVHNDGDLDELEEAVEDLFN